MTTIYLSKNIDDPNGFFLRVLKDVYQPAFEFDEEKPFEFIPDEGGHLPNGERSDLLKVWIKPLETFFPSVLYADQAIRPVISSSSKKIKIQLINTKTNEIQEQKYFEYQKALIEKRLDMGLAQNK